MILKITGAKTDEECQVAEHFFTWLSESGEQQYWDWMEIQERKKPENITIISFDYSRDDLMSVGLKIGRLDEDE